MLDYIYISYSFTLFKSASNTPYFLGNIENRHTQKFEVTDDLGKGSKSIVQAVQLQNTSTIE